MATSRKAGLTLSELEEHFSLTEGSLDKECTYEHACHIAEQLKSWVLLASYLGLDEQQIEAIGEDNQNERRKRIATLTKWKEVFAFKATYRKLATALLTDERADLATEVFKLICAPQPQQNPTIIVPNPPNQSPLVTDHPRQSPPAELSPNLQLPVDKSPSPSPSIPQKSREPTSPKSSGISVGSPETLPRSRLIGKNPTVEKLETKFSNTIEKVEELFEQNCVSLNKLQRIASHLPADLKGEFGRLFKKHISRIYRTKSIGELFAILAYFWDYLQPDLLVYIVGRMGIKEAQMEMTGYEHELSTLRRKVKLQEYIGERRCNLDDDDCYQIAIRLGNEWHEKTLDDLERMRFAFADDFSLLRLVPKLHGLKRGSVTVIFSLPRSIVLNHDRILKFFQFYNPLQVMVDGVSIYNVESQENIDVPQDNTVENTKGESQQLGIMAEEKEKFLKQFHPTSTLASGDTKGQATEWEKTIQGKQYHGAAGSRDVLFIVSSEKLQGPDIVPRRDVVLTKEDIEKLQRLNFSSEEDEASILVARIEMDKAENMSVVGVERSTPEKSLTKEYVLKRIEKVMTSTKKQGVLIRYYGPGRRNTGDWCFEDGYITFRDLVQLYCNCFKGHVLTIGTDCSYSGSWVKELMKFLDEQGVRPCGHSAREKKILIKVRASCQPTEIPYRLLYSLRARFNDKNTGRGLVRPSGFQVAEEQHICWLDPTQLSCNASSFKEPCTFSSEYTWEKKEKSHPTVFI